MKCTNNRGLVSSVVGERIAKPVVKGRYNGEKCAKKKGTG